MLNDQSVVSDDVTRGFNARLLVLIRIDVDLLWLHRKDRVVACERLL